jgi:hypothetical protein
LWVAGALLVIATISRLLRIFRPVLHPFLAGATVVEHLACGFFALVFVSSALVWWRGDATPRDGVATIAIALCAIALALFNLSWELCQYLGLAWYAAQPGVFQWDQVAIDQIGLVMACVYIRALRSAAVRGLERTA